MKTVGEIKERTGGGKKHWLAVFRDAARGSKVRRILFDSKAVAAIELAFILPVLLCMVFAIIELGRLAYFSIEVSNAANAGAQYGAQSSVYASSNAGMVQAARCDGRDVSGSTDTICGGSHFSSGLTVTTGQFCECSSAPGTTVACVSTSCSGSSRLIEYVSVSTSAPVTPLVSWFPRSLYPPQLNGHASIRVAQ
jgi:Flp pilus assembly protein TadG